MRSKRYLFLLLETFIVMLVSAKVSVKTRLTWINGIAYSLKTADQERQQISRYFGGKKVVFCYNPTAMAHEEDMVGYLGDLTQAGSQKLGLFTAEVETLIQHLRDALAHVGERGVVIHIAHSQGALITALASRRLTPDEMQRIEVIAFGRAAALRKTRETPFRRCMNYYSINDPLLFVVPSAVQALRSGFVTDNDEFCFLSPRVGDPIVDHYLLSPTYAQALQWEGLRYQREYQSVLHRNTKYIYRIMLLIYTYLMEKMQERVRAILRPLILGCTKMYLWTRHQALVVQGIIRNYVVRPILLFVALLIEWSTIAWRKWKGENDTYVPVAKILQQSKEGQESNAAN